MTRVTAAESVRVNSSQLNGLDSKKNDIEQEIFESSLSNDYGVNTKQNLFLKEYLEGKAAANGVNIPTGMKINISSFKFEDKYRDILHKMEHFWSSSKNSVEGIIKYCRENNLSEEETSKVLDLYRFHDVRVNVFGARISDMFKLLAQDEEKVAAKVDNMKISDRDKAEIIELKKFFDKYYKVEAEYNGQVIDLLHLNKDSKQKLAEISPEFAAFMETEQEVLKKHTIDFAQKEMKSFELSEAGNDSKGAAKALATILAGNIGVGVYNSFKTKKELKMAEKFMDFVKKNPEEGNKILKKCVNKYNKISDTEVLLNLGREKGLFRKAVKVCKFFKEPGPEEKAMDVIGRYMKKIGMEGGQHYVKAVATYGKGKMPGLVNPLKAVKGKSLAALIPIILLTLQGSTDDCMGAAKDYVQDQNNFGTKTAAGIAALSVAGGIASSFAIAPSMQGIIDFKRAEKLLVKNGFIQKLQGAAKYKHMGKTALLGALFGMLVASSSSGSSWTSMALTRLKLGKNGNELKKKGVITEEDNSFKSTNANMMEYEAYKGKWNGITVGDTKSGVLTGDWTIGSVGGALGLFTHTNPITQSLSFGLQGCSETLTACGYQILGSTIRDSQLDKDKQELVDSVKNN